MIKPDKEQLEKVYNKYNRRTYVHPDPLEFLYQYDDPGDREIVALLASSLAYGKVTQILKSVKLVLDKLVIPLDTHMHRFSLETGLTERRSADIKTALEITERFKYFCREDPVKYDFSITRYGIRDDIPWEEMRNDLFAMN